MFLRYHYSLIRRRCLYIYLTTVNFYYILVQFFTHLSLKVSRTALILFIKFAFFVSFCFIQLR